MLRLHLYQFRSRESTTTEHTSGAEATVLRPAGTVGTNSNFQQKQPRSCKVQDRLAKSAANLPSYAESASLANSRSGLFIAIRAARTEQPVLGVAEVHLGATAECHCETQFPI